MIANEIAFGKSFSENILYNVRGRASEPNPHKCAWHVARNLITDDLDAAGRIMEATASSCRATKPAYHFSIDWDRSEERFLNQAKCIEAADTVLAKIGLAEHQALYFWHVDANHPHMHVVVNRVHEQSGKAWDMWKSKERLEIATHEVARDMGLLQVPGKHNDLDFSPEQSTRATRRREERATEPNLEPWGSADLARIKESVGTIFYEATSWRDLSNRLGEAGLDIRAKGQGCIISDGANFTQLSKMGKHIRLPALEEKFGESFTDFLSADLHRTKSAHSPVEDFDNLPAAVADVVKEQTSERREEERSQPLDVASVDTRVLELKAIIERLDRFDQLWSQQRSGRELFIVGSQIHRVEARIGKAKDVLKYHEHKCTEILLGLDQDHTDAGSQSLLERLKSAIRALKPKEPTKATLKSRLVAKLKKRVKEVEKSTQQQASAKKQRSLEWRIYYRMQKLREAQSRIQAHEFELQQLKAKQKAQEETRERNLRVRNQMEDLKQSKLKGLPKVALLNAGLSQAEASRLLKEWQAENEHQEPKKRNRKLDRDPFDD